MTQARLDNGVTLEYDIHGELSNPVVFPILGISDNITDWCPGLYEPLVDAGFCVVTHELRDMGLSTKFEHLGIPDLGAAKQAVADGQTPPWGYTIHDVAEDARLLLKHLGIVSVCTVGYSYGSMVAQLLALTAPETIKSLVCLQGSNYHPDLPPRTPAVDAAMINVTHEYATEQEKIEAVTNLRIATNGSTHALDNDEANASARVSIERMYYPQGTARLVMSRFATKPFFEQTSDISCPTLILHGDRDPIFNIEHGKDLSRRIPNAKLITLEGAGHNHPLSLQPIISKHLTQFANDTMR